MVIESFIKLGPEVSIENDASSVVMIQRVSPGPNVIKLFVRN